MHMKLKGFAAAALLAASPLVMADTTVFLTYDASQDLWTGNISHLAVPTGSFTDVFDIVPTAIPGSYAGFSVVNTQIFSNSIKFSSGELTSGSGNNWATVSGDMHTLTLTPVLVNGALTLTIKGTSTGGSYGGDFEMKMPVPEPETYGMMLGGLAVLGAMARRRKQG